MAKHISDYEKGRRVAWVIRQRGRATSKQLVRSTRMTPSQVSRGLWYFNQKLQEADMQPLGYDASTHEFFFPTSWEEERSSARWNLQNARTRMESARKELSAAAGAFRHSPSLAMLADFAEMAVTMSDRVLAEIDNELGELG